MGERFQTVRIKFTPEKVPDELASSTQETKISNTVNGKLEIADMTQEKFLEYLATKNEPIDIEKARAYYAALSEKLAGNRDADWIEVVETNRQGVHTIEGAVKMLAFLKRIMAQFKDTNVTDPSVRKNMVMRSFHQFSIPIEKDGVQQEASFMLYKKGITPGVLDAGKSPELEREILDGVQAYFEKSEHLEAGDQVAA